MKSEVLDSIRVQIEKCQGVDYVMLELHRSDFRTDQRENVIACWRPAGQILII
jgi:hypothetical protein